MSRDEVTALILGMFIGGVVLVALAFLFFEYLKERRAKEKEEEEELDLSGLSYITLVPGQYRGFGMEEFAPCIQLRSPSQLFAKRVAGLLKSKLGYKVDEAQGVWYVPIVSTHELTEALTTLGIEVKERPSG